MPVQEILVLHHSHFDLGYTLPQPVLWEMQKRFIDQVIELCEQSADAPEPSRMRWTCEATAPLLYWMKHSDNKQIERFTRLARSGYISAGAMLCNLTPLYDAVELAHSLYPIRELRARFGLPIKTALNHDVNGIPWPATSLLLDAGIELLIMGINVHFGGYPLHRPLAFNWKGSDGRRILAFNGEHYGAFERELRIKERNTDAMAKGFKEYLHRVESKRPYPYNFVYLTSTNHADNSPPDPNLVRMVKRWNDERREPVIRFATPEMLLERLRAQAPESIPEHSGDWTDYWNFGAASSARETYINRQARADLTKAEALRVHNGPGDPASRRLREDAWWQVQFYDEHTWGCCGSIAAPDEENTATQWNHKANYAYRARDFSGLVLRDQLEALAGNKPDEEDVTAILFANPSPVPVSQHVRIWNSFFDGSWRHITGRPEGLFKFREILNDGNSRLVGPIEIPAYGWRSVPLQQLQAGTVAAGVQVCEGQIESPHHRLTYDPSSGRITSLFDKQNKWEVLDASSPWSFFQYVQEMVDPLKEPKCEWPTFRRRALFNEDWNRMYAGLSCWIPDWPALRRGPSRLIFARVEKSAEGATLKLRWDAPGVEYLEQRITLYAHRPAIGLTAELRKLDIGEAEGVYFAFPLNLGTWRAHYDTANLPAELDAEQLPGVVRDWLTVNQWVSVHDSKHCVTLNCPDAPLVQIGGFNFSQNHAAIPRDPKPLLLAWPMNNYWPTNFKASQPGFCRFNYELSTHAEYDPARAARAAIQTAMPIEVCPVAGERIPLSGQLIEVSGQSIVPVELKLAESGQGLILRLSNVANLQATAIVRLPEKKIQHAFITSLLEDNLKELAVSMGVLHTEIPARGIVTLKLIPDIF